MSNSPRDRKSSVGNARRGGVFHLHHRTGVNDRATPTKAPEAA
jgi:hypothetical protein